MSAPDVDTCAMPLGSDQRCGLPGDHTGGCQPLKCLCSHMPFRHVAERGRCRRPGCGCTTFRAAVAA